MSRNVSLKDLIGHQSTHQDIPKDIRFFNQSAHEIQYFIQHNSSVDDENDNFYPIVCTQSRETKAFHLKNDGTDPICTTFDSKSAKVLFIVSDFFREGTSINNRRQWQLCQVAHCNHLVEYFPRDAELPNILFNYEKPFKDDKTEHFCNEYPEHQLSQLNQPIDSIVEQQHLNDCLPIFSDTCGPSRMDTNITSPVKNNSCRSTLNPLANSPDSGILQ